MANPTNQVGALQVPHYYLTNQEARKMGVHTVTPLKANNPAAAVGCCVSLTAPLVLIGLILLIVGAVKFHTLKNAGLGTTAKALKFKQMMIAGAVLWPIMSLGQLCACSSALVVASQR